MPRLSELRRILGKAVSDGTFSHAVMIEGERGSEKEELALWCARALLCGGSDPPCGKCPSCIKAESGNHPDIITVLPEEKKNTIGIDVIRELKETLYYAPSEGRCKVYIIPNAETMTVESQNALLKSLEEPPENVNFILLTENRSFLLDTILSRTTLYQLSSTGIGECLEMLGEEYPNADEGDLYLVALACGGSFGAASAEMKKGVGRITALAGDTVGLLKEGRPYELMKMMSDTLKDKTELMDYFERLGNIAGYSAAERVCGKRTGVLLGPGEAIRLLEIIDKGKTALNQNSQKGLVSGWFVSEAANLFGGNI